MKKRTQPKPHKGSGKKPPSGPTKAFLGKGKGVLARHRPK